MMRQMRENTKWIMLITAVAFVALMVFEWGMDMTGRSGAQASGGELGRVNGQSISYEEYLAVYRNLYQQQQQQMQGTITSAMNRQIEDAAWDQLVTQRLLEQELRRRGIRVSDDEIRQAALYAPPPELQSASEFQTDGQFDPAKYQTFLASPNLPDQFLQQLEAYYRDIVPRSKLFFQTSAGLTVSDAQLWRMWRDANEMATVRFIRFSPEAMIPDADVSVTDQAIRQYYNTNRGDFVRPAQASVRYVVLDRTPGAADTAEARQLATQLRTALLGGESFDDVAARASRDEDRGVISSPVFPVSRGQASPELEQAVFSTPAGQVSEPVLTPSGFQLVRVESREGDLAQIRQLVVPVTLGRAAEDALLDRADELERQAERSGLQQAGTSMGLQVHTGELSPALPILPAIGPVDEGLDWAFGDAEPGETSGVMENEQAFYILELVSRRAEGALSLQEATPTIRTILMQEAKVQRARERLVDAERRARAGEPLEQIAGAWQAQVNDAGPFSRGTFVPGIGRMNAAVGAAFGLRPGETSPLIEAEQHLFLIRLVSRQEPSRTEWQAQVADQRGRVLQALGDTRWSQFMLALRESAEIVDNRSQILRRPATATTR